jgi:hypothetical protein
MAEAWVPTAARRREVIIVEAYILRMFEVKLRS